MFSERLEYSSAPAPVFYRQEQSTTETDLLEEERRARAICACGDYTMMRSAIESESLFESQRNRIISIYGERLERIDFLSKDDWEMLVILELYDTETFDHSLRVFETVQEKLESRHYVGIFLRQHLEKEGVGKEDLLRAALLHDIGKVLIPKEVLNDATTDEEWMLLAQTLLRPDQYAETERRLDEDPSLRYKDVIPFSCAIPKESAALLRARGVDPDQPLGAIVGRHAYDSGVILRSYGKAFHRAAEIAASHHDNPIDTDPHPISLSSLRASWILRAADLLDAIRNPRTYKGGRSLDYALEIIDLEASRGFIDPKVAALFRDHEYSRKKYDAISPGYAEQYKETAGMAMTDIRPWIKEACHGSTERYGNRRVLH